MITTVTMNASIDKAYYMETAIENGTVMRVAKCINTAGGKGINVARIADLCGAKVQATGMVGGFNGMYLQNILSNWEITYTKCISDFQVSDIYFNFFYQCSRKCLE